MSNKTLQSLFHYKRWADGELLDAIATLDAQQYSEAQHNCLRIFNHIHVVDAIFQANLLGGKARFYRHQYVGDTYLHRPAQRSHPAG